jgi:hypothetical protein
MPLAIKPVIERPSKDSRALLYPYRFYKLAVKVKRLLGRPIDLNLIVQVDLVRAKAYLADSIPELVEVEGEVMRPILGEEEGLRRARRAALYYVMRKYRIGIAPEISVESSVDAYKIFWIKPVEDGVLIIDSITGEAEKA